MVRFVSVSVLLLMMQGALYSQSVPESTSLDIYLGKSFVEIVTQFGLSDTCYLNRKRIRYEGGDVISKEKNGQYYQFIENTKEQLEKNLKECYCNQWFGNKC